MRYLTKSMSKGRRFQSFDYPSDMDSEMVGLMDVINNIPGCRTMFCCSGHGGSGWYFSMNSTSSVAARIVSDVFTDANVDFEILEGNVHDIWNDTIPEKNVSVYSKKFGTLPAKTRKELYSKLCQGLMKFVPRANWIPEPPRKRKNNNKTKRMRKTNEQRNQT